MNKLTTATLLITIFVSPIALHAEAFPSKPIRIIVPFNSGGSVDAVVRLAAQKLTAGLGQPFVIENRPGAGGIVGTEYVAKSTQDGYTLLATPSAFVMNVALSKSPSYDPVRDFETISILASYPLLLVSHPSLPVRNLKDLIALAKSQPRNLNYSSGGIGTSNHVAAELFGYLAGVKLTHVAYKGGGPAFTALIGGEVHIMFAAAPTTMPHIKSGKLRVLGVSTAKRSNFFPDIPTISENALGKALAATLITPSMPQASSGNTRSSSPLTIKKCSGLSFSNCITCNTLLAASLIPAIFSTSLAKRRVVDTSIFLPVRPGTLYRINGFGDAAASAL